MKRAFVTGGTGFVGANLIRALLEDGVQVRALVRRGSDDSSLRGLELERVEGDIARGSDLRGALQGVDACFHAAALYSAPDPSALARANVDGAQSVLEAAFRAEVGRIVLVSTMGTLSARGRALRETDIGPPEDASPYARSKAEGEARALALVREGAPISIAHLSAPVGPWDRVPSVTGRRILDVLAGRLPRWGVPRINHVDVGDVARGLVLVARRGVPGGRYLLALGGGDLTRKEFVHRVADAAGIPVPTRGWRAVARDLLAGALRRKGGNSAVSLACDPSWTVETLGLSQSPLDGAFARAVAWFRSRN